MRKSGLGLSLPKHELKIYQAVGQCIYCGSTKQLTREHIIPHSAGGRWVLPESSCKSCATITGKFEGEVARTIIGPLRMLYDLPTRRKKDRPETLPLKVKYAHSADWETVEVDRDICPFLVGLPLYPMPDEVTGDVQKAIRSAATSQFWIRGAGFWRNKDKHFEYLCKTLGVIAIMPSATIASEPFCLMIAKIAHSFAIAEMGLRAFDPFLPYMIRTRDTSNCRQYIGGGTGNEPASSDLHNLTIDRIVGSVHDVVTVRVRILE